MCNGCLKFNFKKIKFLEFRNLTLIYRYFKQKFLLSKNKHNFSICLRYISVKTLKFIIDIIIKRDIIKYYTKYFR